MTEEDFDRLNVHLETVRPVFDRFCMGYGFHFMRRESIGRYPRIRIARETETSLYIDLWMGLDENHKRFEIFRDDLPYSLYAGTFIVEDDGSKYGVRYSMDFVCFEGMPFNQVGSILDQQMQNCLSIMSRWIRERLLRESEVKLLGR